MATCTRCSSCCRSGWLGGHLLLVSEWKYSSRKTSWYSKWYALRTCQFFQFLAFAFIDFMSYCLRRPIVSTVASLKPTGFDIMAQYQNRLSFDGWGAEYSYQMSCPTEHSGLHSSTSSCWFCGLQQLLLRLFQSGAHLLPPTICQTPPFWQPQTCFLPLWTPSSSHVNHALMMNCLNPEWVSKYVGTGLHWC